MRFSLNEELSVPTILLIKHFASRGRCKRLSSCDQPDQDQSRFVHHKILVQYGLMKSPIMFHLCGLATLSPFFNNFEYTVNASISQNVFLCGDSSLVLQSGYTIHALTILVNDNGWNLRLECSGSCPSKFLFSFFTVFLISADWSTTQSVSESRRFETAD